MASYRLIIGAAGGTGTITVDGSPTWRFVDEGTSLTIEIALDPGFVSVEWFQTPNYTTPISTATSFTFVMPSQDVKIRAEVSGTYAPIEDYGVRWTYNKSTINGEPFRVDIEEQFYGGLSEERQLVDVKYYWGTRGGDHLADRIIPSKCDLFLVANNTDLSYDELLTADSRKYRCRVYLNNEVDAFFTGFISPNQLTRLLVDYNYELKVTAVDGLGQLGQLRGVIQRYPSALVMSGVMSGALNQSFAFKRPLSMSSRVYETRMNRAESPFDQFWISDSCLYIDGDRAKYVDDVQVVNEVLFLDEIVERVSGIFVGRVYLWRDKFYFTRLDEYALPDLKYWDYDEDGVLVSETTKVNDGDFECIRGDGGQDGAEETKSLSYNEFTAVLNLGVFDVGVRSGVMDFPFDVDDWFKSSAVATPPDTYFLRRWGRIKAEYINQPSSRPTGDIAWVQYVTEGFEGVKIWGTSTNQGLNDPNLSGIKVLSTNFGGDYILLKENANVISIEFEYTVQNVRVASPIIGSGAHQLAFEVKVGDDWYLSRVGSTDAFEFVNTQATVVIDVPINSDNVVRKITISDVAVVSDGVLSFTFWQLLLKPQFTDQNEYALLLRNFKLNIEENESLTLTSIGVKGITDIGYNLVYDEYETYYGDAETALSTSALRLNQPLAVPPYPVSERWSRDGVEDLSLLQVIVQDLGNRKGKPQFLLFGITKDEPDPTRGVVYGGKNWIITYIEYDIYLEVWRVELWQT